jgi:heme/copper-type cytochrome/quinol oxidase subunit 1
MNISAPKQTTFWIAVVLAVLGVLASLVSIPVLSGFSFWLVVIGFVVLAAGNLVEGL